MNAEELSVELKDMSTNLKYLSEQIEELRVEIEFCPTIDEINNSLNIVKKAFLIQYREIENMQAYKHMAEI